MRPVDYAALTCPGMVTHIFTAGAPDSGEHVPSETCWCTPVVMAFRVGVVVKHRGEMSPAVRESIDAERRGIDTHPHRATAGIGGRAPGHMTGRRNDGRDRA